MGEVRADEDRAGEDRPGEICAVDVRVGGVRAGEVRAAEARAGEDRAAEVRVGEVCAGEVREEEVDGLDVTPCIPRISFRSSSSAYCAPASPKNATSAAWCISSVTMHVLMIRSPDLRSGLLLPRQRQGSRATR
jgi:hypothetical protein